MVELKDQEIGQESQVSKPSFPSAKLRIRIFLKSFCTHVLAIVGYLLGLPIWLRFLGKDREIRILLYHSVSSAKTDEINVKPHRFEEQLNFLTKHYEVISLEDAVHFLKEEKLPQRQAVAITFDDGYKDNYEVVYPTLKRKNIPATIFLLTGEKETERRAYHLGPTHFEQHPLLEWEEAREMASGGISFGSHGETHAHLKDLSLQCFSREITASKKKIESEIGKPAHFFSYPYGTLKDFDQKTEAFVKSAGYKAAFSALFGTNSLKTDRYALRRIGIEASDTLFTFRAKLNGALGFFTLFDFPLIRQMIRWIDANFLKVVSREKKSPLLLVSVDFPPHTDGVSTISRELSARIAQHGERVLVIGPRDKGDLEFDAAQPYLVFRVPGYSWGYLRFLPILFCMPTIISRYRVRRIFAMNIAYGGILSWALSFFYPLEYLIFAYGYEFEKIKNVPWLAWFYRRIYKRAKTVVTCSELVRQRLASFGVEREKIEVLYPAVDLDKYQPLEVPLKYLESQKLAGRKILLSVGRLIERKGNDQVLEALPKVIREFPDVLYCIVGIGPYEKELRKEIERLNLVDHVRFMGKVPPEDLVFLYNACQVFVMPSREITGGGHIEGFGIVYLEANACGKPVIGGRSGGVAEAIRDGETGFLVDPCSPAEITEKITYLLSHPRESQEMGQKGLRWVRESFDWERYTQEAYRFLCGEDLR